MKNKRKYPLSFFFLGVIINMIRTFYVAVLILLLLVIGLVNNNIYIKISGGILCLWIIFAVVEQIQIRKTVLNKSKNEEFNHIMDVMFGENGGTNDVDNN